jgi:hypothetical protein
MCVQQQWAELHWQQCGVCGGALKSAAVAAFTSAMPAGDACDCEDDACDLSRAQELTHTSNLAPVIREASAAAPSLQMCDLSRAEELTFTQPM